MRVCIPIEHDAGLASPTSGHFGNTPMFLVVDTATGATRAIANPDHHDEQGRCHPLRSLEGTPLDVAIVRGIGGGALAQLEARGIRVFQAQLPTVQDCLAALAAGALGEVADAHACEHHAHDHDAAHDQH